MTVSRRSYMPSLGLVRRMVGAGSLALFAVAGMGACGGSQTEPDIGNIFDQAEGVEGLEALQGLEDLEDLDEINDILGDLAELQENGASATIGGADVSMGNTGRPDWLAGWIQFPEEMEYALTVNDPSTGDLVVAGMVRDASPADIEAQLHAMVLAQGYEQLADTGYFVKSGEPTLDIGVYDNGIGAEISWEHSQESEQTLRDAYAPTETTGTLTLVLEGETITEIAGDCTLRSTSAEFEGENASFTLHTFADRDPSIYSSIFVGDGDVYSGWSVAFHGDSAPMPTLTGNGFVIDAMFWDSFSQNDPVPGTASLVCS